MKERNKKRNGERKNEKFEMKGRQGNIKMKK